LPAQQSKGSRVTEEMRDIDAEILHQQDVRPSCFLFWIELLDQHKGHAAARRQASEQLPECVEAACGGAESNDGKIDTRVP
jgi:hypothetical protein